MTASKFKDKLHLIKRELISPSEKELLAGNKKQVGSCVSIHLEVSGTGDHFKRGEIRNPVLKREGNVNWQGKESDMFTGFPHTLLHRVVPFTRVFERPLQALDFSATKTLQRAAIPPPPRRPAATGKV